MMTIHRLILPILFLLSGGIRTTLGTPVNGSSSVGSNSPRDQLIALQKQLKQNTLDATRGTLTRRRLMDETKMTIAEAQRAAARSGKPLGQVEALYKELSESVKKDYSKLTQVYRSSNTLVLEIDELNGDHNGPMGDETILDTKIDEAKKLLEQNTKALEELDKGYRAIRDRISTQLRGFGGQTWYQSGPFTREEKVPESEGNELILEFLKSEPIPPFSKAKIMTIAKILIGQFAELSSIAKRKENEAKTHAEAVQNILQEATLLVSKMDKSTEPIPRESLIREAYGKLEKNEQLLKSLTGGMIELAGSVKNNTMKAKGDLERCAFDMNGLGENDVPEESVRKTCADVFRASIVTLDDLKQIIQGLVADSSKVLRYSRDARIVFSVVKKNCGDGKRKSPERDDGDQEEDAVGEPSKRRFRKNSVSFVRKLWSKMKL